MAGSGGCSFKKDELLGLVTKLSLGDRLGDDAVSTGLGALPKGRVRPPFTQDYGQREFHVADEDCTLVMFGETVTSTA